MLHCAGKFQCFDTRFNKHSVLGILRCKEMKSWNNVAHDQTQTGGATGLYGGDILQFLCLLIEVKFEDEGKRG